MSETAVFHPPVLCPACGNADLDWGPGPGGRPQASCRQCGLLERHRLLALLLAFGHDRASTGGLTLDVAPARLMSDLIREASPGGYVSIDFDPSADGRLVDLRASLTDIPLADSSVGLIVCYHVLEHVPEDRQAMREIARVLRPDGIALVQVPWRPGQTDEDPSASPEERVRRFGQADHVRYYGSDFVSRLEEAGLVVTVVTPSDVLSSEMMALTGTRPDEYVWMCTRSGGPEIDHAAIARTLTQGVEALLRRLARNNLENRTELAQVRSQVADAKAQAQQARAEADRARADATSWETKYRRLRERAPVRAMAAVSHTASRLRRAGR